MWSVKLTSAEAGRIEAWVFKEDITDEHKQKALFIAMTGWMVIVKPVEDLKNDYVYREKRWKAALTGLGLTDLSCTTNKKDLLLCISETMNTYPRHLHEEFYTGQGKTATDHGNHYIRTYCPDKTHLGVL